MNISEATLKQILDAREERAEKQRRFIEEYELPLVCFTMNIAGEVKNSPLIEFAFMCGTHLLDAMPFKIKHKEICSSVTGCSAYYVMDGDVHEIKRMAVELENSSAVSRLFDIDVLDVNGKKLSRSEERKCLICSDVAAVCARSRAHGLETIKQKTTELLSAFAAEKLSEYACEALEKEVLTTPKPGLVDKENCGAHTDMDINTFKKSTEALRPYFYEFVMCGISEHEKTVEEIMHKLRKIGVNAENAMYNATNNVNTHKGLIYSLGLLLSDMGRCLMGESSKLCELASDGVSKAFESAKLNPATHGEMLYQKTGATGIRGEAMLGFPNARHAADVLSEYKKTLSENDARLLTLAEIMRTLEDTNVIYRGGEEALYFMRERANEIASYNIKDINTIIERLKVLDCEFIQKNISPGGCADTLALAVFLDLLSEKHYHLLKSIFSNGEKEE